MALDAKEVQRRGEDLQKAAAANEPASVLLPMLAALKAGVRASEDLLRSTRIGVTVNNLRKNSNLEVAREAGDLVQRWRNEVKKSSSSGGAAAAAAKRSNRDGSSTPATVGGPGAKQQSQSTASKDSNGFHKEAGTNSQVDPDKRTTVTDHVDTKRTGDTARDACIKLMYDGLAFMQTEAPSHIIPLAIAVEKAAFDHLATNGAPSKAYKEKMRSLYQNLRNKTSPHLRVGILATPPTITPERLVRMTAEELKSPERRAEDAKIEKENMDKAMVAQEEKSISSSLQCGRCKQRKVSYSQAQTRSADEPMTTFCECTVCGNRWKFS